MSYTCYLKKYGKKIYVFFKMQLNDGTALSAITCSWCCLKARNEGTILLNLSQLDCLFFPLLWCVCVRVFFMQQQCLFILSSIVLSFSSRVISFSYPLNVSLFCCCTNYTLHDRYDPYALYIHNYIHFNGALMSMKKVALKFMLQWQRATLLLATDTLPIVELLK